MSSPAVPTPEPTQPKVEANGSGREPECSPTAVVMAVHTETKADEQCAKDEAEIALKTPDADKEYLWYFAIGSMMNPTSMNLRNLFPKESRPGILYGWKLVFRGGGGMGDIDEGTPEDNFHGVLHLVTKEEFKHLDSIEAIYVRTPVKVTCYDGTIIEAGAYKMDQSRLDPFGPNALPGERYLDIIMRGAVHYGVAPEYIEKLKQVEVVPRKKPHEYRLIANPPDVTISRERLAAGTGEDGKELLVSIHGKVLKFMLDPNSSEAAKLTHAWSKNRFGGQEATVGITKALYEPLYPIPTTYEAMSEDARKWAEELFYGFSRAPHPPPEPHKLGDKWEVIGWLEGERGDR